MLQRKYIILFLFLAILSVGVLLFPVSLVSLVYDCVGSDILPRYYGSPFIYMSSSLVTSISYDYYLTGLLVDWIIWFAMLACVVRGLVFVGLGRNRVLIICCKTIAWFLVVVSLLSIFLCFSNGGNTFSLTSEMDRDVKAYQMECESHWEFLGE